MKLESTVGGGYTTKEMYPSTSSQTDSGDFNRTLIILIKIFGIVDILLICIYISIVMHDYRNKRTVKSKPNTSVNGLMISMKMSKYCLLKRS